MINSEEQFSQMAHEREWYVAKVFRKHGHHNELAERCKRMNYKPKQIQIKLEL